MKKINFTMFLLPIFVVIISACISQVSLWQTYSTYGFSINSEREYMLAASQFILAAEQANRLDKQELRAWFLNDAANMLIKAHQHKLNTDLVTAMKYLQEANSIANISRDCKYKITANIAYVSRHIHKKS